MRYLIYARKSSEGEDRQIQSIDDQLHALRQLATNRSLTVTAELTEARSAKAPDTRPVFRELLRRISAGEADGIMVWSLNRLFRNSVDYGHVSWMLQQSIIKSIWTVDREYLPEDNVLLMAVEAGVATQYIIDLKKAIRRGLESKAAKGWFPGRALPGYKNNKLTKQIEIDQPRFRLLRQAWCLLLTGAHTVPQIRDELIGWGYPSISRSTLYTIFSNPFYCGQFRFRGALHDGKHRPMVTRHEFERAQEILHRPNHIQPQKHEFPYTGLMRCGVCGCLITAERRVKHYRQTGNTRTYVYYHCTGARGCPKTGVREEVVEQRIAAMLQSTTIPEPFAAQLLEASERHESEQPLTDATVVEQLQHSLRAARSKLERLLDLRLAGELTADEYGSAKTTVQEDIHKLEAATERQRSKVSRDATSIADAIRFAGTAFRDFAGGDAKTKRAIARTLAAQTFLTLGEVKIQLDPVLERLRTFEPPKTDGDMGKAENSLPYNLAACCWLTNIRTYLKENDVDFNYPEPPQGSDRSSGNACGNKPAVP